MNIQIDPDDKNPIYLQIVHHVKHQVATGRLQPGQRLPTQRELATALHVDPNTVARAYDQLDLEQVITTQQGRGTYVRQQPDPMRLSHTRKTQLQTLVDAMMRKAFGLGYTEQEVRAAVRAELERWHSEKDDALGVKSASCAQGSAEAVPHRPRKGKA